MSRFNRKIVDDFEIKEYCSLYLQGFSTCEIVAKYNQVATFVNRYLRKNYIRIRTQSEAHIGKVSWNKGKSWSEETKKKMSAARKGKYVGALHPNWQGGISKLPYAPEFTNTLKLKIKQRDNFTCQHPNGSCKGWLTVHHIDYDKMNCKESNLIVLCVGHNASVNKNRKYWTEYFKLLQETNHEFSVLGGHCGGH